MRIIHIAAEAYPISKSGGLGDVMGSLPKYLQSKEDEVHMVVPFHQSKFVEEHEWEVVFEREMLFGNDFFTVKIFKEISNSLGFNTYLVEIPYLFPRKNVYGYQDDPSRFIFFQSVVLYWLESWESEIDIIHCHDHHTGFIPFLLKNAFDFRSLQNIPTVFTIHNGEYNGAMSKEMRNLLPHFDSYNAGFLEFGNALNPLISAVKCAYAVTTVSQGYLEELSQADTPLGQTIQQEWGKCKGILNGIDEDNWSPAKDAFLTHHYNISNFKKGKAANKKELLSQTPMDESLPLFCFIGRMVYEKGADYLLYAIDKYLSESKQATFYIIGSGREDWMYGYQQLHERYPNFVQVYLGYNEGLARQLYAAADFLLMPSRIEPCGLNQMYAMHYGTIPVVRSTGGLKDTVHPIEDGGNGFTFYDSSAMEMFFTINRVLAYNAENDLNSIRKKDMQIDFSWRKSADEYIKLYQSLN